MRAIKIGTPTATNMISPLSESLRVVMLSVGMPVEGEHAGSKVGDSLVVVNEFIELVCCVELSILVLEVATRVGFLLSMHCTGSVRSRNIVSAAHGCKLE